MRRFLVVFVILAVIVAIAAISSGPVISRIVINSIKKAFPSYSVSIGEAKLDGIGRLSFSDILIAKGNKIELKVKHLDVYYNLCALFTRTVDKVKISGASLKINMTDTPISEALAFEGKSEKGGFVVKKIELPELSISINTSDLKINGGKISLEVEALEKRMASRIYFGKLDYGTVKLAEFQAELRTEEGRYVASPVSTDIFGGKITGSIDALLKDGFEYDSNFKVINVDLAVMVETMNWKEKFVMTGKVNGEAAFKGKGISVSNAKGNLTMAEGGGTLTIKDKKFFEDLAERTKQPLELIETSLKDYKFDKGSVRLSNEGSDIIFNVYLEGAQGKRDLMVVFHDFGK